MKMNSLAKELEELEKNTNDEIQSEAAVVAFEAANKALAEKYGENRFQILEEDYEDIACTYLENRSIESKREEMLELAKKIFTINHVGEYFGEEDFDTHVGGGSVEILQRGIQ
jgi:hypothetical protein